MFRSQAAPNWNRLLMNSTTKAFLNFITENIRFQISQILIYKISSLVRLLSYSSSNLKSIKKASNPNQISLSTSSLFQTHTQLLMSLWWRTTTKESSSKPKPLLIKSIFLMRMRKQSWKWFYKSSALMFRTLLIFW